MKKVWTASVIIALVVGAAAGAMARDQVQNIEVAYKNIAVHVDGKNVDMGNAEPFVVTAEGRTYIPARPLAEALGSNVEWDSNTNTVQVYTSRYTTVSTANGVSTYTLPAWGASIPVPAGGTVAESTDPSIYLQVNNSDVVFLVQRADKSPLETVDSLAAGFVRGFQGTQPGVVFGAPKPVQVAGAKAVEMKGSGPLSGRTGVVRTRVIIGQKNFWFLTAIYVPETETTAGPAVDKAFDGFQFRD